MHRSNLSTLAKIAMFSALMWICGWIAIPTAVPFTMQTFAVLLAGAVLGGKGALLSVLVYIALGAFGLPVFSGGKGGLGTLLGPTGGYIIGFLPCAYTSGKLCERTKKRPVATAFSMALGLLCDYIWGALWYFAVYLKGQNILLSVATGILPFIAPDILKIMLASLMGVKLQKTL